VQQRYEEFRTLIVELEMPQRRNLYGKIKVFKPIETDNFYRRVDDDHG